MHIFKRLWTSALLINSLHTLPARDENGEHDLRAYKWHSTRTHAHTHTHTNVCMYACV